jgi:CRP-like cAMP-binding protein
LHDQSCYFIAMLTLRRGLDRTSVNSSTSKLATLRSTVELAGSSTSELASLLQHVDEITVPAGTRIATRGQSASQLVIVAEGRLRADSPEDGWHTLAPGDTVGWAAMWEMTANEATVIAETDARLLVMGHAQFRAVKSIAARPASVVGQTFFRHTPEPLLTNNLRAG